MKHGIRLKNFLSGIRFSSEPIYDDQYIQTKVKTFSETIKNLFDGNIIPKT